MNYINHSGGAVGADSTFDSIGKSMGFNTHIHYYHGKKTPIGNLRITDMEEREGWIHVLEANRTLKRKPYAYRDLLTRNWFQVKNSDAIFAISELKSYTEVEGGTGWAVQMGIDNHKPVYVFDQKYNRWLSYDYDEKMFVFCEPPVLTENYAGIGTRNLNDHGKKAIAQLYDNTLKQLRYENIR
jgi:hypothetical protein